MSTEIGDENHLQIGFILERLFREFHLLYWMEGATCTAFSSPILSPILCYFEANHKLAISGLSWKPGSVLLGKSLHIAESLSPHWQSAGDC